MALIFLIALAALVVVVMLRVRVSEIETRTGEQMDGMRHLVRELEKEVLGLKRRLDALARSAGEVPAAAPPAQPPGAARVEPKPEPAAAVADRARPLEPAPPPAPIVVTAPPPVEAPAPAAAPVPVGYIRRPGIPAPASEAAEHPAPAIAAASTPPPAPPPPPLPHPERPVAPVPAESPAEGWTFDWESLVGVKLFSWIAGIALVVAGLFFLRYSIEQGWLQPPVRMAIGIVVSLSLLIVCEMKVARDYPVTANSMDAAAVAILFSTFYAAYARWSLISVTLAFFLLALTAAVAVLLAIRRNSLFIAFLGLVGGFATPALVSTGEDHPFGLFGYLLILNAGLSWVGYRKKWPYLVALSLVFTTIYQWSWVVTFLTEPKLPFAVGVFLVFPALGVLALAAGQPDPPTNEGETLFGQLASVSACLPLFFALYLAASPTYVAHAGLLFSFLLILDVGLFAVAVTRGPEVLHVISGGATLIIAWTWISAAYRPGTDVAAWPMVLVFLVLLVAFYLAAPFAAPRVARPFSGLGSHGVLAAPILLFMFPVLAAMEPACAEPGLLFTVLFLLMAATAWIAVATRHGMLHFIAAFFALATEAVWSARYLTPERLLVALVLYALFGLFYLAVPLVARRIGRPFEPEGAAGTLLLVSLGLLFFLGEGSVAPSSLWGMALLLAVLNLALFIEGSSSRIPLVAAAGSILSWLVLAFWWGTAPLGEMLLPAVLVVGGFALLTLGGQIYLATDANEAEAATPRAAIFLGLVGHLFLLFVASQPALAVPPWPMLGVLAVLDLAIGAAALYMRRGEMHLAAAAATQFILVTWVAVATDAPWPMTAILVSGAFVALACAWLVLARQRALGTLLFDSAAVTAVVAAQLVVLFAGLQPGAPNAGVLAAAHVALIAVLLALAALRRWHVLAIGGTILPAIAVIMWQAMHTGPENWQAVLLFALPIYLAFVAYPLVVGRRTAGTIEPYQAAVLAGVPFFFVARRAMYDGGLSGIIGVLPLFQAALMAVLLVQLLRLERPGERNIGRLALVAGTALAFITLAVPLQLEKEWITIAWALEGAALAWLFVKIPHRGLYWSAVALLAVVFVRLALNPQVLVYQPRGTLRIWNWYLYTYLVSSMAMMFAAGQLVRTSDATVPGLPRASTLLKAGGTILLFLLLNIEIADFFATGETITFNFSATLTQDLTYTLGWALFGVVLLAAGIVLKSHPARVAALGLLVVTILKCFLHDLARLSGLYRVASFVGLAICLALVAVVLQKFVLAKPRERQQ